MPEVIWNEHPSGTNGVARLEGFEFYFNLHKEIWHISIFSLEAKWARVFCDEFKTKEEAIEFVVDYVDSFGSRFNKKA